MNGLDQKTARKRAKELGGVAIGARWSSATHQWRLGGWAGDPDETWIVVSTNKTHVLDDGAMELWKEHPKAACVLGTIGCGVDHLKDCGGEIDLPPEVPAGRCEAINIRKGTGPVICDEPLDAHGQCPVARDHREDGL